MSDIFGGAFEWADAEYDDLGDYFSSLANIGSSSNSVISSAGDNVSSGPSFGGFIDNVAKAGKATLETAGNTRKMSQGEAGSISQQGFVGSGGGLGSSKSVRAPFTDPKQFYNQWSFRLSRFAGISKDTGVSL